MKKAAVISLILLLVGSLGTSGYLLLDQKKIKTELKNSHKVAEEKADAYSKLKGDFTKAEGENIENKNKLTAAGKQSDYLKKQIVLEKGGASRMQIELENASKNKAALKEEITNLSSTNKTVSSELETAQTKLGSLTQQLSDKGKQVEAKDKEIAEMRESLEPFIKLGLTPDKILELSKKRPVDLKVPAISGLKPKIPEKLKKPLSTQAPESPSRPDPTIKLKPPPKENK